MLVDVRIRTEKNGGAWCPKSQISRDVYEWIQVDVGELKVVTQVETQGRFGNGQVRVQCANCTMTPFSSQKPSQTIVGHRANSLRTVPLSGGCYHFLI